MKENLMPHNAHPTRRTILTGVAWALPIIAASAAVPAYAANGAQTGTSHTIKGQANGRKTVKTFTVPAGVRELSFTLTAARAAPSWHVARADAAPRSPAPSASPPAQP